MDSKWQPIETAPKDGTLVLLYYPKWRVFGAAPFQVEGGYCLAFWSDPCVGDTLPEDSGWYASDIDGNMLSPQPQLWTPIPEPPEKNE
jgi:hypothetical protein